MSLKKNSLLLCILVAVVLFCKEKCFFCAVCICTLIYARRTKDLSTLLAILLFFAAGLPRTDLSVPSFYTGRVTKITRRYLRVKNGFTTVLVQYTGEPPLLDSIISYDGNYQAIDLTPHFFAFDFGRYCRRQGIAYEIKPTHISLCKDSTSLRGRLQKCIASHPDHAQLAAVLLQQNEGQEEETLWISLGGILFFLRVLLQNFFDEKKMKIGECILCVLLCLLYHAPYILVQRLLLNGLWLKGIRGRARIGIGYLCGLLLFPQAIYSAAFLFPFLYHLFARNKIKLLFYMMTAQCFLFQYCDPLALCFYRFLLPLHGFCWLLALLRCLLPVPLNPLLSFLRTVQSTSALFRLHGSPVGFGLPFFIASCLCFKKHADIKRIVTLWLYLFAGLFHPFAEMITVDIGQGSCVLFRAPLQQANILLDTGPPSAHARLKAMLDAKGIRKLDYLVISHADSDHSGNRDALLQEYTVIQLVEEHIPFYKAGPLLFYDLNPIADTDENRSSIMSWTQFNGLSVLFPGDGDSSQRARRIGTLSAAFRRCISCLSPRFKNREQRCHAGSYPSAPGSDFFRAA